MAKRKTGVGLAAAVALSLAACGGDGGREAEEPETGGGAAAQEPADEGDVLIPEEKFVEIQALFDRKQPIVSRCFPRAVEAGELPEDAVGYVTVGLVITRSGQPTNVRVLETSLQSELLNECVTGRVSKWDFTTLPKDLEYSYTYQFEKF